MLSMQQQQQIAGAAEQPQEEVQLTELLPVKQSRIRENVLKDANATDALRALRSFSDDCAEDECAERDFDLRGYDFCKTTAADDDHLLLTRPSNRYRRVTEARRKRTAGSRNDAGDDATDEEGNLGSDGAGTGRNASKTRNGGRRNVRVLASRRNSARSSKRKRDSETRNGKSIGKKDATADDAFHDYNDEGEADEEEEEEEEEEGDGDEHLYSDLDKRDCFKDEVYVYRRESLEPCSNSEPDECEATSGTTRRFDTDGDLFERAAARRRETPPGDVGDEGKKKKRGCGVDRLACERESSEKELRLKIDAIIQANYLLERENNNVVVDSSEVQKVRGQEDVTSTSATSTTVALTSANDSSDNSSSPCTFVEVRKLSGRKLEQGGASSGDQSRDQEDGASTTSEKKYCCVVCEAHFKGSGGLRNHYKVVHGAGPVFKCDECGKEFPLKERLKLHVRTHTGFKPYKCPECDKSFARGGQLVQHSRTHSQIRPYRCGLCSNSFTCSANLVLHVKRHNGQRDHKCELCGRAFVRRDALKKHLECLHRDVKSFLCAICNKTFKGHLPQHMRTHLRDRPHGCATCGQRFAQKSQLTVHQRTHSGQRPFRCLVCWQAFAHSTALKLHTRRHTGERPFKCTECKAGFTQLPHWKKHMKCIHGRNDPYGCRLCKSYFRIKSDLEKHEKTCHPEMETDDDVAVAGNAAGLGSSSSSSSSAGKSGSSVGSTEFVEKNSVTAKYKLMTVEKMRLLLAVLLKRISKQERLDELGFGRRLIDDVLQDSLLSAGKQPVTDAALSELESLTRNLEIFLEWTVPKEHWENFRRMKKSPEEILEALTAT